MYEIEEYNQLLQENDSYLGYCIEDVYSSTTILKIGKTIHSKIFF